MTSKKTSAGRARRRQVVVHAKPGNAELRRQRLDHFIVSLVRGLDLFIAQANSHSLGQVARILHAAKEDLVFCAVEHGVHETAEERFINRHLYDNYLFAFSDFLARLPSVMKDKRFSAMLESANEKKPHFMLMESLRRVV